MKIITLFVTLLAVLSSSFVTAKPVLLDRIAVVVNENIITQTQIDKEVDIFLKGLPPEKRNIPEDILRKEITDRLVDEELKMQEATRRNIKIDNITLNREIQYIATQQKITVNQLYDRVTSQGIDFADYREKLRRDLTIQRIFGRIVRSRVNISAQEITDFLNSDLNRETNNSEYQLSHISIDVAENASSEELEKADTTINKIYDDLVDGKDFADLAKEFSDSSTGLEGGKLGWMSRKDLPSRFMQVILEMSEERLSKPFRTSTGLNIVKLHDIRGIKKHIVDEVKVRHVLIKVTEVVDAETALTKINEIRESILKGGDFATIAKESSEDTGSALAGGDLGWASASDYVAEFKRVANELPVNKLSQPIKTQFGWHILEVLGRRSVDQTIKKSRDSAYFTLINRKAKEQEQTWITELRSRAYIDKRGKAAE